MANELPYNEDSVLGEIDSYFKEKEYEQLAATDAVVLQADNKEDTNANITLFYQKLEELGVNLNELRPILEAKGNLQVLSGAGAGKTTALILKIIHGLISGEYLEYKVVPTIYGPTTVQVPAKILVSTFLRTGAKELQSAFREWCTKLAITGLDYTNIVFTTIHAEVKEALTGMGVQMKIIEDTLPIVRHVMGQYQVRGASVTSRNITNDEVNDVASILSYARNRLDQKRYEHSLASDYRLDPMLLDILLAETKKLRASMQMVDFEDMQEMLLEALQLNPNVAEFIASRYDYVFVDEFQDTSQLQYRLLQFYFNGARATTVFGDTDQCIYGWRGSDHSILAEQFGKDHNPTFLQLTTNYRCRQNILQAVLPSIQKNGSPHSTNIRAFKPGGEVAIVHSQDISQLMDAIRQDVQDKKTIGVLARTNADLLIPAIVLEIEGTVDFAISKSVSLTNRLSHQVLGLMDLVTKRITNDFESHLRMFISQYQWYEVEKLMKVLQTNKNLTLFTIPIEDIEQSSPNLAPVIKGMRRAKESEGDVTAYLFLLETLRYQVFKAKTTYAQKARVFVDFISTLITSHPKLKDLSLTSLDMLFNDTLPERLARRVKYGDGSYMKLTTVHEAKGKEWDSVYIWNDTKGVFPSTVGNRTMTEEEYAEERRVHYIAWTRAKDKLTVFTDVKNQGDFLLECDVETINPIPEPVIDLANQRVFRKTSQALPGDLPTTYDIVVKFVEKLYEKADIRTTTIDYVLDYVGWTIELVAGYTEKNYGSLEAQSEFTIDGILTDVFERLTRIAPTNVEGGDD